MDADITISEIKKWVQAFNDARDWGRFHHPKELAISISLEAAELLEHFQWKEKEPIRAIKNNREFMQSIKNELSDIMIYSLNFANKLDIDISEAIRNKIDENNRKYPVNLARGKAEKYTAYEEMKK